MSATGIKTANLADTVAVLITNNGFVYAGATTSQFTTDAGTDLLRIVAAGGDVYLRAGNHSFSLPGAGATEWFILPDGSDAFLGVKGDTQYTIHMTAGNAYVYDYGGL